MTEATTVMPASEWVNTQVMAHLLGMHPMTLRKMQWDGYFTENRHWRKLNPTSKRSHIRWHLQRTQLRMNAV